MSKDFEKEYIELAQNEIPDLWDRIEAGLNEKSAPGNQTAVMEEKQATNQQQENAAKSKTKIVFTFKRYAGLAAAILCVALIIPASTLIFRSGGKSYSTDAVTSDESYGTATEAYDTAAEADVCEEAFDAATAEEAGEETYDTAEAADEVAEAETAEALEMAEVTEATAEMEDALEGDLATGGTNKEAAFAESSSSYDVDANGMADLMSDKEERKQAESSIIKNVIVQVTEENNDVYGEDGRALGGTVYTVIICEDASGTLTEGEQIEVYLSGYSSILMSVGEKFDIDIACENDGEYQYVVDRIYLKKE